MKTLLLSTIMKPTWEELSNPESDFNKWNPFVGEETIPPIELSDEDKDKLIRVDAKFEAKVREGNLIYEVNLKELAKQINWTECINETGFQVYLINDEFVLVPYVNPDGAVYRLVPSDCWNDSNHLTLTQAAQ